MYLVVILYALFASVFTVSKTGLMYTQPLFFVGTRMLFAGGLMLAYQFIFQRRYFKIEKAHFWKIFRLAAFNIYLTNVLEFWGLQYLTSFKTCFIYSLSPFMSAIMSYFMFSERLGSKKWLGLLVGFIGFIPILLNESGGESELGHVFFLSWNFFQMMGSDWFLIKCDCFQ